MHLLIRLLFKCRKWRQRTRDCTLFKKYFYHKRNCVIPGYKPFPFWPRYLRRYRFCYKRNDNSVTFLRTAPFWHNDVTLLCLKDVTYMVHVWCTIFLFQPEYVVVVEMKRRNMKKTKRRNRRTNRKTRKGPIGEHTSHISTPSNKSMRLVEIR